MKNKGARGQAVPLADLAVSILGPVLKKRTGVSMALIQSWEELAGPRLAGLSRPERMIWPRRANEDHPFEPATLVVACQGIAALHLQHESAQLIARLNAFVGFNAVGRIRIVQKPVTQAPARARPLVRALTDRENARVDEVVGGIEDPGLREALDRLGRSILGSKPR